MRKVRLHPFECSARGNLFPDVDVKDPTHYVVYLGQSGLTLPDRDYYLKDQFATQNAALKAYVAQMLAEIGWGGDTTATADAVVAFEHRIAEASWTKAQQRDARARISWTE